MSNGNSDTKKHNIIITLIGGICTIIAGFVGNHYGMESQNKYIESQIADVSGDGNVINMNNIDDFIKNYNEIYEELFLES